MPYYNSEAAKKAGLLTLLTIIIGTITLWFGIEFPEATGLAMVIVFLSAIFIAICTWIFNAWYEWLNETREED